MLYRLPNLYPVRRTAGRAMRLGHGNIRGQSGRVLMAFLATIALAFASCTNRAEQSAATAGAVVLDPDAQPRNTALPAEVLHVGLGGKGIGKIAALSAGSENFHSCLFLFLTNKNLAATPCRRDGSHQARSASAHDQHVV